MNPRPAKMWGSRGAALAALGFNVALLGALTLVTAAIDLVPESMSDALIETSQTLARLSSLGMWLGALGFLPWLKATYVRARAIASTPDLEEQWRLGPVAGFFIPFLNFVRPYRAVRVLDQALDPDAVPMPAPRIAETAGSYRESAAVPLPERRAVKNAPVTLWWALWVGRIASALLLRLPHGHTNLTTALHDLVVCASAVAAWLVVWRIAARLEETERRRAALG